MPAESFPLAVICGLGVGALIGYLIYKGGNRSSLQIFLVISTCFLYLVAAGLFSKGVWNLEQDAWIKLAGEGAGEAGSGPGSYDIRKSVWHVNVSHPASWLVFDQIITANSAAPQVRRVTAAGASSTRSLGGKTAQHMDLSSRIICTGSS